MRYGCVRITLQTDLINNIIIIIKNYPKNVDRIESSVEITAHRNGKQFKHCHVGFCRL